MKTDRITEFGPIDLDPSELLGLSQVARVSGAKGKPADLGRLLSKIGNGEVPPGAGPLARLLSKIGGGPEGEIPGT